MTKNYDFSANLTSNDVIHITNILLTTNIYIKYNRILFCNISARLLIAFVKL